MAYIINPNSFVQALTAPVTNCGELVGLCLPVYDVQDISFQFININAAVGYNYEFQLLKNGVEVGNRVSAAYIPIIVTSIDAVNTIDLVVITSINTSDFANVIDDGECFNIRVYAVPAEPASPIVLFVTNCFIRIADECYSSKISYACNENSFGFYYYHAGGGGNDLEGYFSTIRLPFLLTAPQFPTERKVFVKSDGTRKKLSARVSTTYDCKTDYMPKDWHEKLVIALEHDTVAITNLDSNMTGQLFSQEGNYEIDWQKFQNYPTAPALFKVFKTPYLNVNSNCN